jgi:hypothetical protein
VLKAERIALAVERAEKVVDITEFRRRKGGDPTEPHVADVGRLQRAA